MLKLLCCCGQGVSENFKDELGDDGEKAVVAFVADTSSESGAPTKTEYYKAFGIGFLDTLDAVSKFAPKPVPEIVHLGIALIKAFDRAEATLESAKRLRSRIEILIAILIDEVPKDKKGGTEIPERLSNDILQFQKDLNYIITRIDAIEQQRHPLLLVFQSLNEEKIQECVNCLAASLNQFQLSTQITNIHTIEDLKKRIISFQNSLEKIDERMNRMENTLQKIDEKLDTTHRRQTLAPRPHIPSLQHVFYGKGSDVSEAAAALTQTKRTHLALIGQGGIGKTTTALAVLHHSRIQQHFTSEIGDMIVSDRRFWVSCIGVDTVEKFEHALLTAIGGGWESPNARQTAINELKNLEGPILVILDNFETPWDASNVGSEVESILRSLDALPQLSIFVTMRAGEAPCHRLNWHVMSANAVDDGAAKSIYLEMRQGPAESSVQEDAALDELLKMVGNHPLAIVLLAASARKKNATVTSLLAQYRSLGTSMLGPSGTDQYHNMDLCVRVSMDRLTGDFRDAAIHLLARLSMLPVGATMSSFWLEDVNDTVSPSLDLLLDAALVQTQPELESGLQRYTIHPVIRDYILNDRRRPPDVLAKLLERAHTFLETNKYNIGEVGFKERAAIVRTEETNLEAVLLIPSLEDVDDSLIDALLNALLLLAKHHAATSPRLEVAEKAILLAKNADKPLRQAEAFFTMGKNLHQLDRYPEAKQCFESARELFRAEPAGGPSATRAADCLLEIVYELGYMTTGSFRKKMDIINDALAEYRSVPNQIGVGRCFRERGRVLSQACQEAEALEALQEACTLLINSPYDVGLCYYNQSHTNFELGNFEEGDRCGKLATELLDKLGSLADQARHLGWMGDGHNEWGHYESAVEIFNDAIDRCAQGGFLLGLAQAWTGMGLALIEMGEVDLAAKSIEEAHKFSSLLPEGELKEICLRDCEDLRALREARGMPP